MMSLEVREKIRKSHLGKKYKPMSEEGKNNIRLAHLGYKPTEEQNRKISASLKALNLKRSEEAKQKLREIHMGEKNPMWKGGVTSENEILRKSSKFKTWREEVFKRDNYTCVICNTRASKGNRIELHPDHIKPFCLFPELRFDVNNGRTLCKSCHMKTDTWGKNWKHYGK